MEVMMLELSERVKAVGFSEIVKIRNQIMELRAKGAKIFQFEGGEPFLTTPEYVKEACWKAIQNNYTRYAPSSGIPDLIDSILKKVNESNHIPAAKENIIVVNGGAQGLFGSFQSSINPGDDVIVLSPYWTPIRDIIQLCQGNIVLANIWSMFAEGVKPVLQQVLTPKTKLIYVNSPHNPAGFMYERSHLQEIADFAKENNLIIISDEAYEHITYDTEHVSIASFPGMLERTITVFTFSKSYAMTGWRIGYTIAPEPYITGLRKITLTSSNGVNTPTQWAALAAMTTQSDLLEKNVLEYKKRRDLLINGLCSLGLDCEMSKGAFYAFPNIKKFDTDSWRFSKKILDEAHVATVPGLVFGPDGESHLRFSFSTSLETIEQGLESLKKIL
ncbi:MAG: aspartate aminotransferase [Candidatus Fischerbacteria bacterium RBG_13_37_8]|uniref:Aspartate aminotransferase n=1 Tax=Candidatus Fischerbacteria bacterium RBG_13_37_8 TaxID=1817863 RepID=A0A1F5V5X0_9BACT|nr:MAG: aspartate aminotransferase [Candidatus Fischerbacteria bacterium RBG_13_37_8]